MFCLLCLTLVKKNPSRKLKVPVASASLSVWSCWGRCHGYREQLPKTFFFFWQVNRSKVNFFFGCHATPTQYSSDSDPVARRRQGFSLLSCLLVCFPVLFVFVLYLARRSRSPCARSRTAWCSWCRSRRCPLSSSAACPVEMSHRRSCPCTTRLRWETNRYRLKKRKEKRTSEAVGNADNGIIFLSGWT